MAGVSKEEYLKRYLSVNAEEKKKKKRKKLHGQLAKLPKSRIVDDDVDMKSLLPKNLSNTLEEDVGDNDPTVAEFIDERPEHVKLLEKYRSSGAWKVLGKDGIGGHDSGSDVSPERKLRHDSDSDQSPTRRQRHDSDQSPARRQRHDSDPSQPRRQRHDSDQSPARKQRHDSDQSPVRRQRHNSDSDQSPARRRRPGSDRSPLRRQRHDSDQSPVRRQRHNSDSDQSPARRRRPGSDRSPPRRQRQRQDLSPPRKQRHDSDSDQSPRRKTKQTEATPQKKRFKTRFSDIDSKSDKVQPVSKKSSYNSDCDELPFRRHDSDSDQSLPRRRRNDSDSDQFPQRRRRNDSDSDESPPRKRPNSDSDQSPPRKRKQQEDKVEKTLGGKKAGLSSAREMRREADELKRKEEKKFRQLSDERLGRGAATVFRDKSGKRRDLEQERHKESLEEKKKAKEDEKFQKWGKGLKQIEDKSKLLEDALHEVNKPLARYKDDDDLDQMLREMDRAEDPMLAFIKKKKKTAEPVKEKPKYKGPAPPPNRFGILPGYRWDGVNRSNGFEKQVFAKQAERRATADQAYKWSVEDM